MFLFSKSTTSLNAGFIFFKVETVGQIYMAASGAPERTSSHAENIADLALAMINNIKKVRTLDNNTVEIRIGIAVDS